MIKKAHALPQQLDTVLWIFPYCLCWQHIFLAASLVCESWRLHFYSLLVFPSPLLCATHFLCNKTGHVFKNHKNNKRGLWGASIYYIRFQLKLPLMLSKGLACCGARRRGRLLLWDSLQLEEKEIPEAIRRKHIFNTLRSQMVLLFASFFSYLWKYV